MVITALQEKNVRYKITDTYHYQRDFQVNPNFPEGDYLKVLFIEIEKYFTPSKSPPPLIGIGTFAWFYFIVTFGLFGCLQNAAFA